MIALRRKNYLSLLLVLFGLLLPTFAVGGQIDRGYPRDSYLYTTSNMKGTNSIVGFKVQGNGSFTQLPGSPFSTGGSGTGEVMFSENGLVASENGRLLFAVNAGSNTIAVMRVLPNGGLVPVPGSPFPSGGIAPVSLAISKDLLYVSHIGPNFTECSECNVTGFRVRGNGELQPIPGSTVVFNDLPARIPFAIGFNPTGTVLVATRFPFSPRPKETSNIDTFQVNRKTGLLSRSPGSPFVSNDPQPIGFEFNPVNNSQLFITNVVAVREGPGSVSAYLMAPSGQIAVLPGSPFPSGNQSATCWVAITSNGKHMYATNTFSDSISRYEVSRDGSLNLVGITAVPNTDAIEDQPLEVIVSPDDSHLYVVNGSVGGVVGYKILPDGDLRVLPNQPVALDKNAKPFGLVYVTK